MLYTVHENIKQSYKPISNVLEIVLKNLEFYEKFFHETRLSNLMQAQSTFLYQLIKDYPKPHFNYKPIEKEGVTYNVLEEVVKDKTFCEFTFAKYIENCNYEMQKEVFNHFYNDSNFI